MKCGNYLLTVLLIKLTLFSTKLFQGTFGSEEIMGRNLSVTTFFKKAISEEGGIPGFEEFAGNILTSSELSES